MFSDQDLPETLRSRLGRNQSGTEVQHPEADQIAAFAEGELPALERESVLAHFASCSECREVLALSLPAVTSIDRKSKRQTRWFWAGSAAAACLAFAVIWQQKPNLPPPRIPNAQPVGVASAPSGRLALQSSLNASHDVIALTPKSKATKKDRIPTTANPGRRLAAEKQPLPPPIPEQFAAVTLAAPWKAVPAEPAPSAPVPSRDQLRPQPELRQLRGESAMPPKQDVRATALKMAGSSAPAAAFSSAFARPDSQNWRVGPGGTLMHLSDGTHWTAVNVEQYGTKPAGLIVSLKVLDARRIRILTDKSEQWASDDAGLHWKRD